MGSFDATRMALGIIQAPWSERRISLKFIVVRYFLSAMALVEMKWKYDGLNFSFSLSS